MPHVASLTEPIAAAASTLLGGCSSALDRATASLADAARTTKFLRGRLEFDARPDDVFVSSYPRSGTTWTQLIVYLLCTGDHGLGFEHLSQVSPWWERSLAWGNLDADDLARLPGPRIFKSHLPRRWLPRVGRCVYVHRRGEDVALSYYHLYRSHLGFEGSFEQFFERFLAGDLQYGSWFKHVAGWRAQRHDPRVFVLAYEDLKRDPVAHIGRLADFLDLRPSAAEVAEIARSTSFEAMKRNEDKFDHIGELRLGRGIQRGRFLRQGQTGQGRRALSEAQQRAFAAAARAPLHQPEREWRIPDFLH
ncbi:sulfotransferase domain-containing protein [Haliangium sp.]|uniref:sulfotransferase domain-containing protein n=1 Tax=Haliangium sp. TaxID=2663208 RepID=UPI003D0A7138